MPPKTPSKNGQKDRSHLPVVAPEPVPGSADTSKTSETSETSKTPIVLKDEIAAIARQLAELTLASAAVNGYISKQLEGYLTQATGLETLSQDYNFDHNRGMLIPKPAATPTNDIHPLHGIAPPLPFSSLEAPKGAENTVWLVHSART